MRPVRHRLPHSAQAPGGRVVTAYNIIGLIVTGGAMLALLWVLVLVAIGKIQ